LVDASSEVQAMQTLANVRNALLGAGSDIDRPVVESGRSRSELGREFEAGRGTKGKAVVVMA
jgi:hypothetical protein